MLSLRLDLQAARLTAFAAITSAALATPVLAAPIAEMFAKSAEGSTATVDHSAWDQLLKRYVVAGEDGVNHVAYAKFKADGHQELKSYVAALEKTEVTALNKKEQFAYWANLYNAKTIDIVLDKYPVKSIKDISLGGGLVATVTGGPWKAKVLKVQSQPLSLDDIEHGILRPVFKDPRVHYAVNCASFGCPNLGTEAFTATNLEAQLDAGAKSYVNHPRGFKVTEDGVEASSIYSWFQVDFGGSDEGVLKHAARYAAPELKSKLESMTEIDGFSYDWSLNDAK